MTCELSATQVEEDALKVSAEVGAPRIYDRRLTDRIHRLALMNVAEKAEHRLNVLDDSAHGRRSHMLEEDLPPHRLRLEVGVQLRSQVKACPEGWCVDVENGVFRIADATDGPVEDLLEVCLLQVAGASPRRHVRVAAAEDLVRARVDHVALGDQDVGRSFGPQQVQHVIRVVVADVDDDRDPFRLQSFADELQPCTDAVSTEFKRHGLELPRGVPQLVPPVWSDRHRVPSLVGYLALHFGKLGGRKTDLFLAVGIPVVRPPTFFENGNKNLSEDVASVNQEIRMVRVRGVDELSKADLGTVQIAHEENPVGPHDDRSASAHDIVSRKRRARRSLGSPCNTGTLTQVDQRVVERDRVAAPVTRKGFDISRVRPVKLRCIESSERGGRSPYPL